MQSTLVNMAGLGLLATSASAACIHAPATRKLNALAGEASECLPTSGVSYYFVA